MMLKINSEKYIQLFVEYPELDMVLSGWECYVKYFLSIPYIVYTKKLIK
jgi:hypothetical protein